MKSDLCQPWSRKHWCFVAALTVLVLAQAGSASLLDDVWHRIWPARANIRSSVTEADTPEAATEKHWALLIAGSSGWGNYRHQADVCHAYHVLRKGGLPDERIVVMMYDDLAHHIENPHPGKIFNRPGGPDVYRGVPKDYTGEDVNTQVFLAVLEGNAAAVAGIGSGKVIKSGARDRVFLFYSDHGAPGVVGMPSGPFLFADQLLGSLQTKAANGGFQEFVAYIEACESGSMFEGLLDSNSNVYVTTAANAFESSWATYCPGMDGTSWAYDTCLGDLYSVAWLENSDKVNLTAETLEIQYRLVRERTSRNYTYIQGSHVMQYGALAMDREPAAAFLTNKNGTPPVVELGTAMPMAAEAVMRVAQSHAPQRDADLLPLVARVRRAKDSQQRNFARAALEKAQRQRAQLDWLALSVTRSLLVSKGILTAEARIPGRPLVRSWDCLRAMVHAWETACGRLDQYGMRHTGRFAALCDAGVQPLELQAALLRSACGASEVQ